MDDLLLYLGAYLIGSLPVGYLVLKGFKKIDLLKNLNGPMSLPQLWKITGVPFGLFILMLNILKGGAAIYLARAISPADHPDWILAGFLTLLGDEFSVFLKFKGFRDIGVAVGVFGSLLFWMMNK